MAAQDKKYLLLRAKTLDCATMMGTAVGKEKFAEDAMQLVKLLCETKADDLPDDDPQMPYIYGW